MKTIKFVFSLVIIIVLTGYSSAQSYSKIGEKNNVTLSAKLVKNTVAFEVKNNNSKDVDVNVLVTFECKEGISKYQKYDIKQRISVGANSTKSYESNQAACSVERCSKETKSYAIKGWTVDIDE